MAASGVLCGITGTDKEEDEDMVEGSMALETLLMHRTISSTSINYTSIDALWDWNGDKAL